MAPTVPTVAYVGYKDGHKAIVAVSLIKNYAPSSLTDLQKDKDAYWRSRGSEDEGFYPADVLELGGEFLFHHIVHSNVVRMGCYDKWQMWRHSLFGV